jgi:hypothetical protein
MRLRTWLAIASVSLGAPAAAQVPLERTTFVAPLPGEDIRDPCEYRLLLPTDRSPVRAVWAIYDRGPDHLRWFHDPDVRKLARELRMGLMLAVHCRSKDGEDMNVLPAEGLGRALLTALDQFAQSEKRPELASLPVIHQGWSGAGSLAARMAGFRPNRYLAGIGYAPGQYEPLGMDTIDLSAEAVRAPQLIIANGGDTVNGTELPYRYFRRYFEPGAPWTFALQNRTPHCCLQNAKPLILAWIRAILSGGPWCRGIAYIVPGGASLHDSHNTAVFNAQSARIAKMGDAAQAREMPAGCLPSPAFAREWLRFERRFEPPNVWKP